jgi:hypothetical protein
VGIHLVGSVFTTKDGVLLIQVMLFTNPILRIKKNCNMAARIIFSDENGNEMECYLNNENKVFVSAGPAGDDGLMTGYITLDKSDVTQLINVLSELKEEMRG